MEDLKKHLSFSKKGVDEVKAGRIISRIEQLTPFTFNSSGSFLFFLSSSYHFFLGFLPILCFSISNHSWLDINNDEKPPTISPNNRAKLKFNISYEPKKISETTGISVVNVVIKQRTRV